MISKIFKPGTQEPAHPMQVRLLRDLIAIYEKIKSKYQVQIDDAIDRASQQIGYVVHTSIPVNMEIGAQGLVKNVTIADESLQGTLFDTEITKVAKKMSGDKINGVSAGTYSLDLFWEPAVKMVLDSSTIMIDTVPLPEKTAGVAMQQAVNIQGISAVPGTLEPAHYIRRFPCGCVRWYGPGVLEPAHYLPGVLEPVHTTPGFTEPAHFVPGIREPAHFVPADIGRISKERLTKVGPGIPEPVHHLGDFMNSKILIMAIDKVYTELKIADTLAKVAMYNATLGHAHQEVPGINLPPVGDPPQYYQPVASTETLRAAQIKPVRPPVGDPPQYLKTLPDDLVLKNVLAELSTILKKFGL